MALVVGATTTATQTASGTTPLAVTTPVASPGDLLLFAVSSNSTTAGWTISVPAGLTTLTTEISTTVSPYQRLTLAYRFVDGTEAVNYSFGFSAATNRKKIASVTVISGATRHSPFADVQTWFTTSLATSAITFDAVTTGHAASLVLGVVGIENVRTVAATSPATTERWDAATTGTNANSQMGWTDTASTIGSYGGWTGTASSNSDAMVSITAALSPVVPGTMEPLSIASGEAFGTPSLDDGSVVRFRGATSAIENATGAGTVTVTTPVADPGDLLLFTMGVARNSGQIPSMTPPTGFTFLVDNSLGGATNRAYTQVSYRFVTGGENPTYAGTMTGTGGRKAASIMRFSGVDPSTAFVTSTNSSAAPISFTSLTVPRDRSRVVGVTSSRSTLDVGPVSPAGVNHVDVVTANSGEVRHYGWSAPAASGASGTFTVAGGAGATATLIALSPATRPLSIGSEEAFGSPTVAIVSGVADVSPDAIGSGEAFGVAVVTAGEVFDLAPASIASGEAVGTPLIVSKIRPTGIGSGQAFGTLVVGRSPVVALPSGIGSEEAFGSPIVLSGGVVVSPGGIASSAAVGTPAVTVGETFIHPTGIAAGGMGTPRVKLYLLPSSVASAEAVGTPIVVPGEVFVIIAGPIPSAEAFGQPTVTPGPVELNPAGIVSSETFGTAKLNFRIYITGVPSAGAVGTPALLRGPVFLQVVGIASGQVFGVATLVPGPVFIEPQGIASAEAVPSPFVLNTLVGVLVQYIKFIQTIQQIQLVATAQKVTVIEPVDQTANVEAAIVEEDFA